MSLPFHVTVEYKFKNAMVHCDNLLMIEHRTGGGRGRGRMVEASVNRAVIVLAIASWQAFVQDTARLLLSRRMPRPSDVNYGFARLIEGQVLRELDRFSTPNAENTRNLLKLVGFDPRPYWSWEGGGPGTILTPQQVEDQLRDWLKIRHAIAHGDEKIPAVAVLEAVRWGDANVTGPHGAGIRVGDARQCTTFVKNLAKVTLAGVADQL